MNRHQMELTLDADHPVPRPLPAPLPRRRRRFVVARWWFARMRDAVHSAREWNGASVPWGPPEQVHLPLTTPPTRFNRRSTTEAVTA